MWLDSLSAGGGLSGDHRVRIAFLPHPMAAEVVHATAPAGLTVEQLLLHAHDVGLIPFGALPFLDVALAGHALPRANWARIRPKAGADLMVMVRPRGGNSLRGLFQLFTFAVLFVGGLFLGLPAIVAGLVAAIGSMLITNALFPIRQPDRKARIERYSLAGANNQPKPNEAVPILLGRRRIFPPRAANWYTVLDGQTVYLRLLFQPSVGWCDHELPRIGETDISGYDGVTLRWHTRPDESIALDYFTRTVLEDNVGINVLQANGWQTRTVGLECEQISLDLGFLSGLFKVNNNGDTERRNVTVEIRYGPRGGNPDEAEPAPIGADGRKTFSLKETDAYRETFTWAVPGGQYDVHIKRITADSDDTKIQDKVTWLNLRCWHPDPPIKDAANTPWLELQVKATDQFQSVLDNFSFIATSMVKEATASGPGSSWIASRNPADLFLAVSYPPFSDLDIDADERDFATLAAWRSLCEARGWHCDLIEPDEVSVGELLLRVAAAGHARPNLDMGALTVVIDWEKPAPKQMFSARTVQQFSGSLLYPDTVDALRLRFANAAKNYDDDTVVVYADGQTALTANKFESIELSEKTDIEEVIREGQRMLAERVLRAESFTFTQDVEQLAVRVGDRAWLQHPAALIGQVAGRVMAIVSRPRTGGGTQYGVRLDEMVTMVAGRNWGLAWRPATGLLVSAQVDTVAGDTDTLWFTSNPITNPPIDTLVAFGERLLEVLDVIVDRLTPKSGLTAEIGCIPYAPELQDLDSITPETTRTPPSIPPGAGRFFTGVGDFVAAAERDRAAAAATAAAQAAQWVALIGGNMIFDPSGLSGFTSSNGTTIFAQDESNTGALAPRSAKFTANGFGGPTPAAGPYVQLRGGEWCFVGFRYFNDGPADGQLEMKLNLHAADGTELATIAIPGTVCTSATRAAGWSSVAGKVLLPTTVTVSGSPVPVAQVWPHWAVTGMTSGGSAAHIIASPYVGRAQQGADATRDVLTDGSTPIGDGGNTISDVIDNLNAASRTEAGLGTGSATITRLVRAGRTLSIYAVLSANTGGSGGGLCVMQVQISPSGAGSWAALASVSQTNDPVEPVFLEITTSYTNIGTTDRLYDFRVVTTNLAGRIIIAADSYMQVEG